MATAVIEAQERVRCVQVEGLALLKIVKHCHESLPHMVTGSLLGLMVDDGVLEITHAFPFPSDNTSGKDGKHDDGDAGDGDAAGGASGDFQLEMMRMLREVNVDNNCVGWYQSMYLGIFSTSSLLENQLAYQTDLSANAVVLLYDPIQTRHGNLVIKCFRLSDECLKLKRSGSNAYVDPQQIFEQVPIEFTNPGLVRALLADLALTYQETNTLSIQPESLAQSPDEIVVADQYDTNFDRLDLSTNPYLEKHLEFLCSWMDDLASEYHKFQYYSRSLARSVTAGSDNKKNRGRNRQQLEHINEAMQRGWSAANPDAPRRMESLLISNQIRTYCDQMDQLTGSGLGKLYLASSLHNNSTNSAGEAGSKQET